MQASTNPEKKLQGGPIEDREDPRTLGSSPECGVFFKISAQVCKVKICMFVEDTKLKLREILLLYN